MEVISLENIRNVGKFGTKVKVAKGYGRNFLIPQGKAVPASKDNLAQFEVQRAQLEKAAQDRLLAAQERAAEINALRVTIKARAADEGKLYGSIGTHELVKALKAQGLEISKQEIRLPNGPLREIGEHAIDLQLHAEVVSKIKVTIIPDEENK
jgi:large subunit ribosomal protein L9